MVNNSLHILFFGQLTELIGCPRVDVPVTSDTDELQRWLLDHYPALQRTTYVLAVDRKIVRKNIPLYGHEEIALLPPFSGG